MFEKLIRNLLNRNITIDKAEIKQNKFAEMLDILRAYPARGFKYIDLKMQKVFMMDGKKLFMGLKMEYYHFLKCMIWKMIAMINNQIDISEQIKFNDLLEQMKEEQKI